MLFAGVAELVDAPDLGSGDESRGGSSPSARTTQVLLLMTLSGEPVREDMHPPNHRCRLVPRIAKFDHFRPPGRSK